MHTRIKTAWFDWVFAVGITLLTVGLCLWSLPLALIVLGLVLCAIALRSASQSRASTPELSPSSPSNEINNDRAAHEIIA